MSFTKQTILLIEDDDDDYMLITEAFNELGILEEIVWVKDGEEALKSLNGGLCPELIILDLNMPAVDGRELLRRLKCSDNLRQLPVVVLTTSGSQEDIDICYKLGANSYVKKPSDFSQLMESLKTIVKYWLEIVQLPGKRGISEFN